MQLHHVQLAVPVGSESQARDFWTALGFVEIEKPPILRSRGGCWFRSGTAEVHVGIEDPFSPARKAHPGFLVEDLNELIATFTSMGIEVSADATFPGYGRFYANDPFGNRLEFLSVSA